MAEKLTLRELQMKFLESKGITVAQVQGMDVGKRAELNAEFEKWKKEPEKEKPAETPAPANKPEKAKEADPAPVVAAPETSVSAPAELKEKKYPKEKKESSKAAEPTPTTLKTKTLVIDTVDRLYTLCESYFLVKVNKDRVSNGEAPLDNLGDLKWGKGYTMVEAEFNRVISKLNFSGYPILFLCHEAEKTIEKKHIKIDRIQPDLGKRAMPIIFDLSDMLVYYGYNDSDERVLWSKPTEDRVCGCRGPIGKQWPETITPMFDSIDSAIKTVTGKCYADRRCIITIYGAPKIGKSSLASTFPNVVVADIENGWKFLDGHDVTLIQTWPEFLKWCSEVTNTTSE